MGIGVSEAWHLPECTFKCTDTMSSSLVWVPLPVYQVWGGRHAKHAQHDGCRRRGAAERLAGVAS